LSESRKSVGAGEFERLSPWAILHFAARTIMRILSNAFAIIPAIYALYQVESTVLIIAMISGAAGLVLLAATLKFLNFSYLVSDSTVQIREGVFSKKQLNLQFARIQNINIEHPFYFRPLGLVTVKIDGAGSASEEVFLAALELEEGENVRASVQQFNKTQANRPEVARASERADEDATSVDDDRQTLVLTRSLADLVIHGLTNNRAWIILGAVGAFYGQASDQITPLVAGLGLNVGGFLANRGVFALLALFVSVMILAVMIMAGLSVLASIFSYYGYELHRTSDAFLVRRGLLTHHEINMKKSRIQAVRIRRDWLDMVLGRMNVTFEQISHQAAREPGQGFGFDKHVLVPSVEDGHTRTLLDEALRADHVAHLNFTGISPRYLYKMSAIITVVYFLIVVTIGQSSLGYLSSLAILPIWTLHLFLLYMRWKRWGLAVDAGNLVIRKGVLGVDHAVIPAFKVQEISRRRTPLMRRHDLSSLHLRVASGRYAVPYLPDAVVAGAINYSLFEVESTSRSWM
jgi:putative membrane protein